MIVALSFIVVVLATVLLIAHYLERAPEAFEDGNGFHILSPDSKGVTPVVASSNRAGEFVG